MTTDTAFHDEIAELVGTVPGVVAIYSAEPVIANTMKAAVTTFLQEPATPRRVHVTDTSDGVDVSLHIAVAASDSAAAVTRAVYDAMAERLTAQGQQIKRISIKVGRIG